MRKAYDNILQSEVDAEAVAKCAEGAEPYRYECSCCGEEVYLAAVNSISIVPHFRHRSGNNDVACENYLGQYGAINIDACSRKSRRERVEFYFINSNKTFCIGIRFSEEEIQEYEKRNASLELRTNINNNPFYVLPINGTNFTADVPTQIYLSKFSSTYYFSNTIDNKRRKYDFFKLGNTPSFFKFQGEDSAHKAKLVHGQVLFTNTRYFIVAQSKSLQSIQTLQDVQKEDPICFETMGLKYFGITISIQKKTVEIDNLLNSWGYQIEANEFCTLLWPPAPLVDDVNVISSDFAFLHTSFKLQAHGNINVHSADILAGRFDVSRIFLRRKVKIFKKNTEVVISRIDRQVCDYSQIPLSKIEANRYVIPDAGLWVLFNSLGVSILNSGQVIFLTPGSVIQRYESNYSICIVYPELPPKISNEKLLHDILLHCKRIEKIEPKQFLYRKLSETASLYIEKCIAIGSINSVAKQFILEGLI